MASTVNRRIRHWCELEWSRNQVWISSPDLNQPAAWSLTHFISSFSFSALAFWLNLGNKPFGLGSLWVDVCACVLLKNTHGFWCINYLHHLFSAFCPIVLGAVQAQTAKTVNSPEVIKYKVCSCQTHKQVITAQRVASISWSIDTVHIGTLSQEQMEDNFF